MSSVDEVSPSSSSLPVHSKRPFTQSIRYAGHLVLFFLLLFLGWHLPVKRILPIPRALPQLTIQESLSIQDPFPRVADPGSREHYLQRGVAPLTVRIVSEAPPPAEFHRSKRTTVLTYKVQPGDTVLEIAQKFGLKGTTILWANDKLADNPDFLRVGQELYILPVDGAYHTVKKGETIESIAARYKVEPSVIVNYKENHLQPPYELTPGQKLVIPGGIRPYTPRRVFAYSGPIPKNAKRGTGRFVWPMSGIITQRYWEGHRAIDIGAPLGTPIVAADSGFVVAARWTNVGYGRMVIIDHRNGFKTLYAHLQVYYVQEGQSVSKGQVIGKCGSTGNSTGPHLHFEIIKDGVRRNPFIYLP
ncbi:MAG: peptidoglycan DD-metalloendopeptidase family protein [Anaerolineae bacterium]|nr:peptidoglycan DD-metalloendopeptidase family protein [Anaerolineae bacterium]